MSRSLDPTRLKLTALAQAGEPMSGQVSLRELPRLACDLPADAPPTDPVSWRAQAQWRTRTGAPDDLWLHLQASAQVPLDCQRCLAPVVEVVEVDRWFRFVESEEEAAAQDDEAEEDLLVLEPLFDLLALLEDELIMGLPHVPVHERCPAEPALGTDEPEAAQAQRPHPFAALAALRKKPDAAPD